MSFHSSLCIELIDKKNMLNFELTYLFFELNEKSYENIIFKVISNID
jgi:hypothetical protein